MGLVWPIHISMMICSSNASVDQSNVLLGCRYADSLTDARLSSRLEDDCLEIVVIVSLKTQNIPPTSVGITKVRFTIKTDPPFRKMITLPTLAKTISHFAFGIPIVPLNNMAFLSTPSVAFGLSNADCSCLREMCKYEPFEAPFY